MQKLRNPVLIALFCVAATGLKAAEPEIRQFDIPTLEKLGHDMYVQDQAVWHANDALFAVHPKEQLQKEKIGGWIVEERPEGTRVRFIRQADGGPEAGYDVTFRPGADYVKVIPAVSEPADRQLSASEKAQFFARTLAIESVTKRCGDNYNTVVLRDPNGEGWIAWALAATLNPQSVMVGGHRRLTVSTDGGTVLRMDALSRGCLILDKAPKDGSTPTALVSVQIVSQVPVETFVFLNLQHHIPFIVLTPDRTEWGIENGKIRKLGTLPEKQ